AQAVTAFFRATAGCRDFLAFFGQGANGYRQRFAIAFAHDTQLRLGIRLDGTDQMRQVGRHVDGIAIDTEDHVTHSQTSLRCRAAVHDLRNQCTGWTLKPEGLGQIAVHLLNDNTQPASADFALGAQLLGDIHRDINRDGERQSHKAARAGKYLRVDANDLALQVEQRPARVARVDRNISLNERHIALIGQVAPGGADYARRYRMVKAERRADG